MEGHPMKKRSAVAVMVVTVLCCLIMALVDGVIRPGYAVKSAIKIVVFLLIPLIASRGKCEIVYLSLLKPKMKGLLPAIGLGLGIYGIILGGYFIVSRFYDFSVIAGALTSNAGVTGENFLYVSLYISFVNSFLEEFFFRGFTFTNLKRNIGRMAAHLFSATAFCLYHVAMMVGWFSPVLFLLVMAGLVIGGMIFNWLNEKVDTIYCSWLTHMFANFAINTVGFILLK